MYLFKGKSLGPIDQVQMKTVSEIPCSWIRSDALRLAGLNARLRNGRGRGSVAPVGRGPSSQGGTLMRC